MADYTEFRELLNETKRQVERECNRMVEQLEAQQGYLKVLASCGEYAKEYGALQERVEAQDAEIVDLREQLQQQNEQLQQQNEQLQQQQQEIENLQLQLHEKDMRLSELQKLSAGMAKKSSYDDVARAMRTYLNVSRRKTLSKREAAKTVLLELISATKLDMPADLMNMLNHFDDETPDPTIVIQQAADVIADGGIKNIKNIRNIGI